MRKFAFLTIAIVVILISIPLTAQPANSQGAISVTDLGTLAGLNTFPASINDLGQVVGKSGTGSGDTHAFLWTEACEMQDLLTLGGRDSEARDINDSGQVVGYSKYSMTSPDSNYYHAFHWENGIMTNLGTLGGKSSRAYAINDSGQVVGASSTVSETGRAVLWTQVISDTVPPVSKWDIQDLGTLGGKDSAALDINNSGHVVGWSWIGAAIDHAFLWTEEDGMQDLDTLGGPNSSARAINDQEQVVGNSTNASGYNHAFLWTKEDGMQDLDTLGGSHSAAIDINLHGQVVGNSTTASGDSHAFLWTKEDGMQDLQTLGGINSFAYGINDSGQVVGYSDTASGDRHFFLWTQEDGMQDLETLCGSFSVAADVNDLGQVVGKSGTASGDTHAFLWTKEGKMKDLGTLGGSDSRATAINNLGQVLGYSDTASGEAHAFLWTKENGMQDLETLGGSISRGTAINDLGQVSGWSGTASAFGDTHAFLWPDSNGKMQDLETLGGIHSYAYDINDSGQVVGMSENASGIRHAFLWPDSEGNMLDLYTLGGDWSEAFDINNIGQVVGASEIDPNSAITHVFLWTADGELQDLSTAGQSDVIITSMLMLHDIEININDLGEVAFTGWMSGLGYEHAFLWDGEMKDLGTLGGNISYSTDLNDLGQVVGYSRTASGDTHAFLWAAESKMQDLETLGGPNSRAWAVNDLGQVVGSSTTPSGVSHAVLWSAGIDADFIPDDQDNAPNHYNPDQSDIDSDGTGDVAEPCPNDPQDLCDPDGSASAYIDPEDGGTLTTPDGSVTIEIPPGALSDGTSISITDSDSGDSGWELTTDSGTQLGIFSFDLQPPLTFDQPVTIVFSWSDDSPEDGFEDTTGANEDHLTITKDKLHIDGVNQCFQHPIDDGILPDCDTDANTFTIEVTSWSEFVLAFPKDTDGDEVADNYDGVVDNCLTVPNSEQTDSNGDGQGDACDPVITMITPPMDPQVNNQPLSIGASFTDADDDDNHTAEWNWGDGATSLGTVDQEANTVINSHSFADPGVYTIKLTVTDSYPASAEDIYEFIVIYDPESGFVTGGGWINSPTGAYTAEPELTGKANFGFVSKYKKGTSVPTGNTEFQFHAGDLNFHSDSYQWLVVNQGGKRAQFKGSGTINGALAPNGDLFQFQIWATDEDYDTFRIRIWWEEEPDGTEYNIYDNGSDQPIGGGNIVVHAK